MMWSDVLFRDKELTLKISFNYVDDHHTSPTAGRKGEKRGKSSVTKRMLSTSICREYLKVGQEGEDSGACL